MRNDLRTRLRVQMGEAVRSLHEKRRLEMVDILRRSGVDVRSIPRDCDMWRDEEGLHLDRFTYTEDGKIRLDGGEPLIEEFTVKPDRIPDWIPFG